VIEKKRFPKNIEIPGSSSSLWKFTFEEAPLD
jgi:hypothetical protein